ncbi:biotin-protein ligase [Thraustotheca clavata]|uniref:DNA-directed RNA polymerase III subunit RPC3 n=1 Tax=Thraustotheca clavata TaxID=74557 RepID=A0A1V9Z5A0_9STRA|nr:biotin-protein ligase [Thraustotheca clavata]
MTLRMMSLSLVNNKSPPAAIASWAAEKGIENVKAAGELSSHCFPNLTTRELGQHVLFADTLPSTQTLLQATTLELRPIAPENFRLVCWTPHQSTGKGRGSNTWVAPEGCLTFSYQSFFTDGQSLPFVQYLVSLAIVRTTQHFGAQRVAIKWPNDIYVDGKKIAGVLCQSEYFQGRFCLTTGIGININNPEPTTCLNKLIEKHVSREEFLAAFCNIYEPMEEQFIRDGFEPFVKDYTDHWLHTNQLVKVQGDRPGEPEMSATIQGLTSTGCLLAHSESGQRYELYPDGNSFDFFSARGAEFTIMGLLSQSKRSLVLHVLHEHFGEHVECLARVLMKADEGGYTLREILLHAANLSKVITPQQLKAGLLKLLQHNMLDIKSHWHAEESAKRHKQPYLLRYELNHDEVLRRLRFARYIELAENIFGEEGAIIMEELLICGRLRIDQSIETMALNLAQTRRAATGNHDTEVDSDEMNSLKASLRITFLEMAKNRYIVRVHPLDLNHKKTEDVFAGEAQVVLDKPSTKTKTTATPKSKKDNVELDDGFSIRRGTKRKARAAPVDTVPIEIQLMMQAEEAESASPPPETTSTSTTGRRRRKEAKLPSVGAATISPLTTSTDNDDISIKEENAIWRAGITQLTRELRHRACIKFAKESVNDVAEIIVSAMLAASSPHERGEAEPTSFPMSARDLFKLPAVDAVIPSTSRDRWKLLLNYLTAMCQHPSGMLTKVAPEVFDKTLSSSKSSNSQGTGDGGTYAVHMQNIIKTLERKTVHAFVQDTYGTASARILRVIYEQRQAEEKTIGELALLPASETRSRLFELYKNKLILMQEIPKRADYNPQYTLYTWTVNHKALVGRLIEKIEISLLRLRTRRHKEAEDHKELIARSDQLVEQHDLDRFDRVCRSLDRFDRMILQLDRMLMLFCHF